ncbi:hypothetical protein EV361DRAFT_1034799 [Lentinula raphanica]|nr:hypothetical protein EV361DRAFT_1034799 [Lentinula raphanica]
MPKRSVGSSTAKRVRKKARRSRKESSDEEEDPQAKTPTNDEEDVVDVTEQAKAAKEAAEKRIRKDLAKRKSPVYAFFDAEPQIDYDNTIEPKYLVYRCTKCGEKIRQGLQTGDRGSTALTSSKGNMRDHVKRCSGEEALAAVKESTLDQARRAVREMSKGKQSTLTAVITTVRSWFKINSTRPPEKEKIRVVTARWAAESMRPFRIVSDRCYQWLQKEGRPNHYVPSKETVGRDVKILYAASKEHLAEEFQVGDWRQEVYKNSPMSLGI